MIFSEVVVGFVHWWRAGLGPHLAVVPDPAGHEEGLVVHLDVVLIDGLVEVEVVDEALLLEVAYGVVVGVRQQVHDPVAEVVLLQLFHESGAVSLDLRREI